MRVTWENILRSTLAFNRYAFLYFLCYSFFPFLQCKIYTRKSLYFPHDCNTRTILVALFIFVKRSQGRSLKNRATRVYYLAWNALIPKWNRWTRQTINNFVTSFSGNTLWSFPPGRGSIDKDHLQCTRCMVVIEIGSSIYSLCPLVISSRYYMQLVCRLNEDASSTPVWPGWLFRSRK